MREIEELRLRQLRSVQGQGEIKAFSTDGCSGFQSRNWAALADSLPGFERQFGDKPPWESCCVAHDKIYWRGETLDGYNERKQADQALKQCIIDIGAQQAPSLALKFSLSQEQVRQAFSLSAELMYQAVRLGGQACSLLPWRWGYGWDNCAFAMVSGMPAGYSDVKPDERLILFDTAAWLDSEQSHWNIPLHAWIYEPQDSQLRSGAFAALLKAKYGLSVSPETQANFRERSNLLIADNQRDKRIVVRIAGKDVQLANSQANGHAYKVLKLPVELVEAFADQGRLSYFAVMPPSDAQTPAAVPRAEIQLPAAQGLSVISDIDDTIKISQVTDTARLLDNTFFQDFQAVPGMAERYRRLAARGAVIHFVSSSPWQLYPPLRRLLHEARFPPASMSLKMVRFSDETLLNLFKDGSETKPAQIEAILRRYPERRFMLIGDNGEQDPEVYGAIARRHPTQIQCILIRKLDAGSERDARYQSAFQGIARGKWRLFDTPDALTCKPPPPS